MDPRIGDFISKNRKKYTREAITQQLIEAGHDPADVAATWAALDIPDPDEAGLAGEGFWSRFFLFLVGLNVAVFLLVAVTANMFEGLTTGGGALLGVFAVALGIGALLAWGIVAAVGPDKMGRTTATIIGAVIPLVFALLIGGSCFALASAIGPPPLPTVRGEMQLQIDEPFTFQASGEASCQPHRGGNGYGVYAAGGLGQIDGQSVFASVDAYDDPVAADRITNVSISAHSETEPDPVPMEWFTTPATRIEAEVTEDGFSGTVTFAGLTSGTQEGLPPATDSEAISGSITWTCEETAP